MKNLLKPAKGKIFFKILAPIVVCIFTTPTFTWALPERFNIDDTYLRQRSARERGVAGDALTIQIMHFTKDRIREFGKQILEIESQSVFEKEGLWSIERFLEDKRESTGTSLEGKWDFSSFAVYEGRPVGYIIGIRGNRDYPYSIGGLFVFRFAVHPDFRGKGIGKKLLHTMAQKAERAGINKIYLETWSRNKGAQRLYESVGFKKRGSHIDKRKHMKFFEYVGYTREILGRTSFTTIGYLMPPQSHYNEIRYQDLSAPLSSI